MDIMCICTINVVQGRLGKNVVKSPLTPCLNSATMIGVPYKEAAVENGITATG